MRRELALVAACSAIVIGGCGGGDHDDEGAPDPQPVVTVGDTPVTLDELDRWTAANWKTLASRFRPGATLPHPPDFAACVAELRKARGKQDPGTDAARRDECRREYQTVRTQSLQQLVLQRWIELEAEARGVAPTDAEFEREWAEQTDVTFPVAGALESYLADSGLTEADLRARLRQQMLDAAILDDQVERLTDIKEADVRRYYRTHRDDFRHGQTRQLAMVKADTRAEAAEARERIEAGDSWTEVVRDVVGPDAGPFTTINGAVQGSDAVSRAVARATQDELVGPIKGDDGWYVFTLLNKQPPGITPLDDARQEILPQLLSKADRRRIARDNAKVQAKWRKLTTCEAGYSIPECGSAS
ncbi:MAG TPA: peptidyl-prolyl cis-trans isomerase [Capillimicrobium sp.]|nr:peptidyl-prolyl cis-trans isomerase [Capillimicrobium sp.]